MRETTSSKELALRVAAALEDAATGARSVDVVLRDGPDLEDERDRLLTGAWHHLQHFADDGDIRSNEPGYDRAQRDLLLRYAKEIRRAYEARQT